MQNKRRLRQVVYKLKRQYRHPVVVYHPTGIVTDIQRGTQKNFYSVTNVSKAAVLPHRLRTQKNSEAERKAWSSFYDQSTRQIIIGGNDLSFKLSTTDFVGVDGERYSVGKVWSAEDGVSYMAEINSTGATSRITCFDLSVTTNAITIGEVSL